jgi:hypothetical protein
MPSDTPAAAEPLPVTFVPAAPLVDVYDFAEVVIRAGAPVADPFRAVEVTATFGRPGEEPLTVEGFCDAADGSVYWVRLLPTAAGPHAYCVTLRHAATGTEVTHEGTFEARSAGRRGIVRVDPEHPWHFAWSGTGERFFWNATTAYLLAGCAEDDVGAAIDRLADLGVNRLRVALCPSRQKDGGRWYEPQVKPSESFTYLYGPWPQARPDSLTDPGWDVTRFDVAHWRKFERLLARARERDVVVQVIFFVDAQEGPNYPFARPAPKAPGAADFDHATRADDPDERRYYAYAAARLAAFANVEWCITNEWALFQSNAWVDETGAFLRAKDPYGHLLSVHGHGHFPFRTSPWCTHALFQSWDEHGGHGFLMKSRQEQAATGRPLPQVNEEYGYEDHYPGPWGGGRVAPARDADSRRRLAWEMTMAGAYQTTGESAADGAGGWINGRRGGGPGATDMLDGNRRLKEFFSSFAWWRLEPWPDLAGGAMCLAEPGARYVVYLPQGATEPPSVAVEGDLSEYAGRWYDPRVGAFAAAPDTAGDWAYFLERRPAGSAP